MKPFFFLASLISFSLLAQTNSPNVVAWGSCNYGQCYVPPDLTNAIAIGAGWTDVIALRNDGSITYWGTSTGTNAPVPNDWTNMIAISAGRAHRLGLRDDHSVAAWGWNDYGQCNVPQDLSNVIAVAAGGSQSLALKADRTVVGWGAEGDPVMAVPLGLENIVAIAASRSHSMALKADGHVVVWGHASGGGTNGLPLQNLVPDDLTNAVAIADGDEFCVAVRDDGSITQWGIIHFDSPHVTNAIAVSAGDDYALAILDDGSLVYWGGGQGQSPPGNFGAVEAISCGHFSSVAILATHPKILSPLRTRTLAIGSAIRLTAQAVGQAPLHFQWFFNGTNAISGATNSLLDLSDLHASQSGMYSVVVTNDYGVATAQLYILNILPSLDINLVPAITLRGEVGSTYSLEYLNPSGPINAWSNLATLTITNNPQLYFDVSAMGQPSRFYRLVISP